MTGDPLDKTAAASEAVKAVKPGASLMVGGFGIPGTPMTLVQALVERGVGGLTLIKNEANIKGMGVSRLVENGQVDKLITSHLGLNEAAIALMNEGRIEVEFNPQGILAERVRAGGAGLQGILTDIGLDTILREGKQTVQVNGREAIIETALTADVAFIHAETGDRYGNLVYEKSARNFNPAMATAGRVVVAEVMNLVEIGALNPNEIHTPGAFVDYVVEVKELIEDYTVLEDYVFG